MKRTIKELGLTFAVLGCLNWGLIGLFQFDFIAFLLDEMSIFSRSAYSLIGLSTFSLFHYYSK